MESSLPHFLYSSRSLHVSLVWSTESQIDSWYPFQEMSFIPHTLNWNYWGRDPLKVAKVIDYMPDNARCSLVFMRESLPKIKPNPEVERLKIPVILFENLQPEAQKVKCLQMNFISSQINQFHFVIKQIWVMFLSLASEKVCPFLFPPVQYL